MLYQYRLFILISVISLFCCDCGKKNSDDEGGTVGVVPGDWDGTSDYPNSRWEFLSQ